MALHPDRNRAQSVFHRYNFKALRPGDNDKDLVRIDDLGQRIAAAIALKAVCA